MTTSLLENKILNLQARLKADNDATEDMSQSILSSPRQGSGRRPKQRKYMTPCLIFLSTVLQHNKLLIR